MVVMFLLYHIEQKKKTTKISLIYDTSFNDSKRQQREVFIMDMILKEYLYLKNIENDKKQIIENKNIVCLVNDSFYEKISMNYLQSYEGIIPIYENELFYSSKNIFWKFKEGYCFVLICELFENNLMASNFLNILLNIISVDLLENTENLILLLDDLLPNGQLLYLTQRAAEEVINK